MKVALFCFSPGSGGAEKSLIRLYHLFLSNGVETLVVFGSRSGALDVAAENIHFLSQSYRSRAGVLVKLLTAVRLFVWLKKNRVSVVISTLPLSDEIVRLTTFRNRVHRIANLYGRDVARLSGWKRIRRQRRYCSLYRNGHIVCLNQTMRRHFQSEFHPEKISVVHNFIPEDENLSGVSLELKTSKYVVHVGRFVPQKRHDFLLDAWKSCPDLPCLKLLCASTPCLNEMIAERGLEERVEVVGYVQEPIAYIKDAEALVLCSEYEGFPSVLLEGMSAGVRVISTPCGGVANEILVDHPELVAPDRVDGFVEVLMKSLASNVPCYSETLQKYSSTSAFLKWKRVLEEVVQ